MSREMESALNRLEAAQDGGELWEATRKVLTLTLPFEFCCLNFYPFLATPPMIFRERPFDSLAHFQRFVELNPCVPYVMANPGIRWVRLTDRIAESELLGSKYYQDGRIADPGRQKKSALRPITDSEDYTEAREDRLDPPSSRTW